jgi:hypothetical protein
MLKHYILQVGNKIRPSAETLSALALLVLKCVRNKTELKWSELKKECLGRT